MHGHMNVKCMQVSLLQPVQTGSEAHRTFLFNVNEGSSRVKVAGA
jgi:hypothetical protein